MKVVGMLIGSVLVILGVLYGLALIGIIPVKKMAAKSPAMAKILTTLHLAPKASKPDKKTAATPPDPLAGEKKQLADAQSQLAKDRAAFVAEQQAAASANAKTADTKKTGDAQPSPAPPSPEAKLVAIYATMPPEDLARIFAKLPDPAVVRTLSQLDEKKAGKVLAALPDTRAARLSLTLSH